MEFENENLLLKRSLKDSEILIELQRKQIGELKQEGLTNEIKLSLCEKKLRAEIQKNTQLQSKVNQLEIPHS